MFATDNIYFYLIGTYENPISFSLRVILPL